MIRVLIGLITLYLFLACSDEQLPGRNISFSEDSSLNTPNPDRGFYDATYHLNESKEYNMFETPKEAEYTLVYALIDLEEYLEVETLPADVINTIDSNLMDAEESSVKLILRIRYRSSDGEDPSKEIVIGHLNQLKTTLVNHKDIISIVQAGSIGAYGEWHSFTGDYAEDNEDYIANRKDIIDTLNEIFPNKYIQVRYPVAKEMLYGSYTQSGDRSDTAKITSEIAFSDDIRAKIAHHNDCFLASDTDWGTYPTDDIEYYKDYVINDTKYSPVGGETCRDNSTYTNCSNALSELKTFQYSFINEAFNLDVIQRWKDEACYEEIKENIGYRLVAEKLNLQQKKDTLEVLLYVTNKGYGAPYIEYDFNLILQNEDNSYTFNISDIDMRKFYPGETIKIETSIPLADVEAGQYRLFVYIGGNYSSVRFSNSDMWDDEIKANILADIRIL